MTAVVLRLHRRSLLGIRWAWLVEAAEPYLDGTDPWRLYPLNFSAMELPPELPMGPVIYGALGADAWQYCGLTLQPLRVRLNGHTHDSSSIRRAAKASRWVTVAALSLNDETPALEVGRLERKGKQFLRPRMGSRWSHGA